MAKTITQLRALLAERLQTGCQQATNVIKENTPIDTQRLFESVEATNAVVEPSAIRCRIRLGGKSLFGIRREQNVKKPVNYGVYVEARYGFVRQSLGAVKEVIIENLKS